MRVAAALLIASEPLRAEVTKDDVARLEPLREAECPSSTCALRKSQGGNDATATGRSR